MGEMTAMDVEQAADGRQQRGTEQRASAGASDAVLVPQGDAATGAYVYADAEGENRPPCAVQPGSGDRSSSIGLVAGGQVRVVLPCRALIKPSLFTRLPVKGSLQRTGKHGMVAAAAVRASLYVRTTQSFCESAILTTAGKRARPRSLWAQSSSMGLNLDLTTSCGASCVQSLSQLRPVACRTSKGHLHRHATDHVCHAHFHATHHAA